MDNKQVANELVKMAHSLSAASGDSQRSAEEFVLDLAKKERIDVKRLEWAKFVYAGMGHIYVEGLIYDRDDEEHKLTAFLKIAEVI